MNAAANAMSAAITNGTQARHHTDQPVRRASLEKSLILPLPVLVILLSAYSDDAQ